jgi:hypothetical protein
MDSRGPSRSSTAVATVPRRSGCGSDRSRRPASRRDARSAADKLAEFPDRQQRAAPDRHNRARVYRPAWHGPFGSDPAEHEPDVLGQGSGREYHARLRDALPERQQSKQFACLPLGRIVWHAAHRHARAGARIGRCASDRHRAAVVDPELLRRCDRGHSDHRFDRGIAARYGYARGLRGPGYAEVAAYFNQVLPPPLDQGLYAYRMGLFVTAE